LVVGAVQGWYAAGVFSLRYPPFTDKKLGNLLWLVKKKPKSNKVLLSFLPVVIVGILLGILFKVS